MNLLWIKTRRQWVVLLASNSIHSRRWDFDKSFISNINCATHWTTGFPSHPGFEANKTKRPGSRQPIAIPQDKVLVHPDSRLQLRPNARLTWHKSCASYHTKCTLDIFFGEARGDLPGRPLHKGKTILPGRRQIEKRRSDTPKTGLPTIAGNSASVGFHPFSTG